MTANATPLIRPTAASRSDHARGVDGAQLAGRQRAHRHRHGLGAGVAAHGGHDRHQHGQRHHLLDRGVELLDDAGGEHAPSPG